MCVVGRHNVLAISSEESRPDGQGIASRADRLTSAHGSGAQNSPSDVGQDQIAGGGHDQGDESLFRLTLSLEQLACWATSGGMDTAAALFRAVSEQLRLPR